MIRRIAAAAVAALGATVALSGCQFHGAYSLPLPGGASHGKQITLTADYQLITNPAYNADRGPVSVFSGRFHGRHRRDARVRPQGARDAQRQRDRCGEAALQLGGDAGPDVAAGREIHRTFPAGQQPAAGSPAKR